MPRLRILLADDNQHRARLLAQTLAADRELEVVLMPQGKFLTDAVAEHTPDLIIVDMSRPDRDALEPVRRLTQTNPRPIVLFVDADDPAFMEEAISAGVSSYNVVGVPLPDVKPILRAAIALFRRHEATQSDLREAGAKLKERAVIDKAKAILIGDKRLTEPDAYRWLQRRAMAGSRRIIDVAEEVVRMRGEKI